MFRKKQVNKTKCYYVEIHFKNIDKKEKIPCDNEEWMNTLYNTLGIGMAEKKVIALNNVASSWDMTVDCTSISYIEKYVIERESE